MAVGGCAGSRKFSIRKTWAEGIWKPMMRDERDPISIRNPIASIGPFAVAPSDSNVILRLLGRGRHRSSISYGMELQVH